jgi:hypothetical protein
MGISKNNEPCFDNIYLFLPEICQKGSSWFNSKSLVSGTMEFRLNLAPPK